MQTISNRLAAFSPDSGAAAKDNFAAWPDSFLRSTGRFGWRMGILVGLEGLDLALRGSATGICLILAVLIWFSRISLNPRASFVCNSSQFQTLAHLARSHPTARSGAVCLQFISTGGAFFTTWVLRVIFLDQKRYMWMRLVSGAVACLGLLVRHHVAGIGPCLRTYAALHFLALVALFVYPARDDLHIARRRIRPTLAVVFGLYSFAMALTLYAKGDLNPVSHALGQSVAFLFVVKNLVLWMLKVTFGHWPGKAKPPTLPSIVQQSQEQSAPIKGIQTEMKACIWQVEGLTVGALASRVKAPEHQMRKAINQVLGHRNFPGFIKSARIEAAKERLSASDATDVSVLKIAYDVGFASFGPFNRGFRELAGLSPTDYRAPFSTRASSASCRPVCSA